ncbi:MAG: acylphosphatase [Elusimicrobia bacterium]|nr:acylphosphatase [Elusimicrobiota bacterium]
MGSTDPLTRRHLLVRGRVQGVGFRWFARGEAETLGLSGWVRNREDGTVEAEAEGDAQALTTFVERLRVGCPSARVDSIEERTSDPRGGRGFEIRR